MAGSRKQPNADPLAAAARLLESIDLRGRRVAAGLSGGVDSVVLLHVLRALAPRHGFTLRAVHVHHGLSPNADAWRRFCAGLCRELKIPCLSRKVKIAKRGGGLEAVARAARYAVYSGLPDDAIALGHQLDDQAETVLMNLLRGAGARGASAMPRALHRAGKLYLRPLLEVPREAIVAYAVQRDLPWIEDESNADEERTRNFLRRRVGTLLAARFPRWRENLARAARHFASSEANAQQLLRGFLAAQGLRAPSEAKLVEMLKQLTAGGARTLLEHDGARLRVYRGKVYVAPAGADAPLAPQMWKGERRLPIPALGGELRFRRARGDGIDAQLLARRSFSVRLRAGGERLRPDPLRPRRTLKNLFQEHGVPPWQRERLPLIFCGERLVWVPGLGVDAAYRAAPRGEGLVPEWHAASA